jgi:SAM-dependent methyltransferase
MSFVIYCALEKFLLFISMDYNKTFQSRGTRYLQAINRCPHAIAEEFQTAVRTLDLQRGHSLLNIPAAAVLIEGMLPPEVHYYQIETSEEFAKVAAVPHGPWTPLPFPADSLDRVLCLASLHHSSHEERAAFYGECLRVLKPGGKLVVGDVRRESNLAPWLNVFVNQFNSSGHRGIFFSQDDVDAFRNAGFEAVGVVTERYTWNFNDSAEMVDFCQNLFGLDLASQESVLSGLTEYLHPVETESGDIKIPWELIYFTATKGGPSSAA